MLQRSSSNPTVRKHSTIKPAQKVYITDHFLQCELFTVFLSCIPKKVSFPNIVRTGGGGGLGAMADVPTSSVGEYGIAGREKNH